MHYLGRARTYGIAFAGRRRIRARAECDPGSAGFELASGWLQMPSGVAALLLPVVREQWLKVYRALASGEMKEGADIGSGAISSPRLMRRSRNRLMFFLFQTHSVPQLQVQQAPDAVVMVAITRSMFLE